MSDLLPLINQTYPRNREPGGPLMVVVTTAGTYYGRIAYGSERGLVLENGQGKIIIPTAVVVAITDAESALAHKSA